jgi:hypothetical protein
MKTLQNKQRYHFVILLRIMIFFLFTVSSVQAQIVSATGGTVTTSGLYTIHTFTSSGTFSVISGGTVEYLVIAGGGGGGGSWTAQHWTGGGGGGAGGYRSSVSGELSGGGSIAESALTLGVGAHSIVVGAGGSGGSLTNNGNNGFDSYIQNPSSVDIVRSIGGGGGAGAQSFIRRDGLSGGSGGGAAGGQGTGSIGGSGTTSQGYIGGLHGTNRGSGGGGGAGGLGVNSAAAGFDGYYNYAKTHGGTGGPGVFSSITGVSIQRGGGGGGGCDETFNYLPGIGGLGGGGTGGTPTFAAGTPGTANTGGGGGGGTRSAGGAGGSGIVIIRYLTTAAGPLPIELLDFTAILNNNKVNLNWRTVTEINNNYFTVERSKDGINFEFVAKVQGAGNSTTTKQYVTLDEKPYQGLSYYRLKQTDFDGKFNYSKIVYVNFKKDISKEVKIYPNPVTNELNMEIPGNTEPLNFELISLTGAVVYKGIINEKTRVQTSSFAPGTYLIKFASDHTSGFKKVIKQ